MEAKFIITPTIKATEQSGVAQIRTDMLMLTKISGMGLGPGPQAVDQRLGGRLSKKILQKSFQGELGEHLTLQLGEGHPQRNVLLVGLGRKVDLCGLREAMKLAVERAIAQGCSRLSIPIPAHRLSQMELNLAGLSNTIKEVVQESMAVAGKDKKGVLEIELVCTPQAKRHLEKGLNLPIRGRKNCCKKSETEKS